MSRRIDGGYFERNVVAVKENVEEEQTLYKKESLKRKDPIAFGTAKRIFLFAKLPRSLSLSLFGHYFHLQDRTFPGYR